MRTLASVAALTTLSLAFVSSASAQAPNDRQYCDALIQKYRTYVNDPNQARERSGFSSQYEVAISKCRAGDTSAGIPPLEKALRGAKVDLPSRG